MAAPRAARAAAVGVFLLAAAYFALGATIGLEWTDEGQIVYPSWLVAQGELPYRDFRHGYGPSLFLWNGLLLRLFGADLLVIRLSLILLKAAAVVLVWALSRRVAGSGYALAAAALLAALWGGPWWIFNAPYANHYGIALGLAGLLALLALPGQFLLGCALAGLCCGVAATFKQTNGVFSFIPVVLYLLCEPYFGAATRRAGPAAAGAQPRWSIIAVQLLRAAALLGALVVCIAYAAPGSDAWTFAVLLTPIGVTLAVLAQRVWRDPAAGDARRVLYGLSAASAGFLLPLLAYAAYYGAQGQLGALLFNVSELVRLLRWFDPLPRPPLRATLMVGLLLLAYLGLVRSRSARRTAGLLAAVAAPIGVVLLAATWGGSEWYLDAFRVLFFVPFVVVALSLAWLVRPQSAFWNPPSLIGSHRGALALLHLNAATSLLYMYPAADFWHLAMIWPAFLPLLAYQLACAHTVPQRQPAAVWVSRALLAFVLLGLLLPQVAALASTRRQQPDGAPFARASRITGSGPKFAGAAQLVQRLDELDPTHAPLLMLTNEQLLYFLAGRRSIADGDEFALYLVGAGLIDTADAQRLLPEQRLIDRLRATHARVVDADNNPMAERFNRVYPGVRELLVAQYDVETTAGGYRILRWRQ